MNRLRLVMLFGVLALIVALVPAAAAQDQTFGLTQAEYDALIAANNNSSTASSYDYAFTMDVNIAASGDGAKMAFEGTGTVSDGFSMDMNGSITAEGETTPTPLSLIVVDDSLYISNDGGTTWYGSTGEELMQMVTGMAGGMLPVDPAALASGDLSGLEGQMGDMSGMMTGLEGLDATQFVSITAAPDGSSTVYTLSLDVGGLLATEQFSSLLGAAMMSSGAMGDMGAEQPSAEEMAMMGQMFAGMFGQASATLTQTVDTSAQVVTNTVLAINIPMDAMGSAGDGISMSLNVSLSNYNAAPAVTAPADAQPLSGLLGGMMGGM